MNNDKRNIINNRNQLTIISDNILRIRFNDHPARE